MSPNRIRREKHLYVRGVTGKTVITNSPIEGDVVLSAQAKTYLIQKIDELDRLQKKFKGLWRTQYILENKATPPVFHFALR